MKDTAKSESEEKKSWDGKRVRHILLVLSITSSLLVAPFSTFAKESVDIDVNNKKIEAKIPPLEISPSIPNPRQDKFSSKRFDEVIGNKEKYFSDFLPLNLDGSNISQFPGIGRTHGGEFDQNALDIICNKKSEITNVLDGKVVEIGEDKTYGNYVIVESSNVYGIDNSYVLYAHMERVAVIVNQQILAGESLGICGNSGFLKNGKMPYHLHIGHINISSIKRTNSNDPRPFRNHASNHKVSILKIIDARKYNLSGSLQKFYKSVGEFLKSNSIDEIYFK